MNKEILFVDDDPNLLAALQRILRKEFRIDTAVGGAAALALLHGRAPYAVVVADMQMPEMSGVEFLMEMETAAPETVRIMLTGNADQKTARDAVNQGHIFRFLTKPCPQEELIPSLHAGLRQYQLITAEREVLEKTLNGSARMLSDILATHDAPSFGKSQRLIEYMLAMANHLQLKQTWDLELAAMLSQIGYVTIPQAVLARSRSGVLLSGPELDMVRRIPPIGHDLLCHIPRLESAAAVVLYQNKNFDGTGFPVDDVAGENIPIGARILRVLQDLIAHESTKISKAKALEVMAQCRGRYDPVVLEAVASVFDIYLERTAPAEPTTLQVGIKDLRVGCILTAAVLTRDGVLIVPAGTQISPMLMEKLRNFANLRDLEEPMWVRPQSDKD